MWYPYFYVAFSTNKVYQHLEFRVCLPVIDTWNTYHTCNCILGKKY